jgi:N-acetylglucosaminyldiphosphoundecaprenol N-acetyl-beta-D-mannosaminyltransferase
MNKKVSILDIPIDKVTMTEALIKLRSFLDEGGTHIVYTPNAEILMAAQRDNNLLDILKKADMLVADGAGVVLASRILGDRLPEKVSGFDLVKNSLDFDFGRKLTLFFLGSKPGIADAAAVNLKRNYPSIKVVGCRDGYFTESEEGEIISQINEANPDILLVALGAPKQEFWIDKNYSCINARICIGVGGTLDILSGSASLAPPFFRNHGLEWLYRLYKEPWRYKRMMDLPRFIVQVIKKRVHK